jgi:hypothetical protein
MSQIAQVPTAVMVNGVRTIIAPGQTLPAATSAAPAPSEPVPPAPASEPETQSGSGDKPGRKAPGA